MKDTPSVDQLRRAVQVAEQIEKLESELASILGQTETKVKAVKTESSDQPRAKRKYTMSPEAREKIAAAQKRRWAKAKRTKKAADKSVEE